VTVQRLRGIGLYPRNPRISNHESGSLSVIDSEMKVAGHLGFRKRPFPYLSNDLRVVCVANYHRASQGGFDSGAASK